MSVVREKLVAAAINRAFALMDYNIHNKQQEFLLQMVLGDKSLTNDEKTKATRILNEQYDRDKVRYNNGTKRICENCNKKCLSTLYCELCVREYLIGKFSNWTSGDDNI